VWSTGAGNPAVYTSLRAFSAATGRDVNSIAVDGGTAAALATTIAASKATVSRPLPAKIAPLVEQNAGARHLGAW
jgi:hypothetical protein